MFKFFRKIFQVFVVFLIPVSIYGETIIGAQNGNKPWMLFITQIIPPRGLSVAPQFSAICFQKLSEIFDTTSFQIILLQKGQQIENLSNRKKDLILSSDTSEFCSKGISADTLILWLQYKVGFHHCRIAVPYTKGKTSSLPDLLASHVFASATSEFLGTLSLQVGPPGVAINISEDIIAYPPCTFLIPPGTYFISSSFPQFQKRLDTLEIIPGKQYAKRILLLPID